ncbi:MobF family relaxase [Arthrobacter pigmenti]
MTVSIGKISIDYYLESAAAGDGAQVGTRDLTAYYTETQAPAGRWWGHGLAGAHLQVGQQVEKWSAKRVYEDFADPETGEALGRRPIEKQSSPDGAKTPTGAAAKGEREAVAGFDLTFSVPKSVSVLWALADTPLQVQLHDAHQQAVEECLSWLEKNVAQGRAGHGGVAKVAVKGVIGSLFDHWDSRAGDPQLHTHAVLANRVQRISDDEWVTLDSYTLHRHVVAVSEMYNSLLFDRIAADTGAVAELRDGAGVFSGTDAAGLLDSLSDDSADTRNPRAELSGVPDGVLEEFSLRSAEIDAATDERVRQWHQDHEGPMPNAMLLKILQEVTLSTRKTKGPSAESLPEKMLSWRRRSINAGYTPEDIVADATGHTPTVVAAEDFDAETISKLAGFVVADAGMRRATFMRANLIASTERILRGVRMPTASGRHALVDRVVEAATVTAVPLTPERFTVTEVTDPFLANGAGNVFDQPDTAKFTTGEVFNDEQFLINWAATDGPSMTDHRAAKGVAAAVTREGHRLSDDQAYAAQKVLASGKSLDAVIGPAGTGKTTTMKAIRDLWERENGKGTVVGLAPSAVAAAVLGEEIDAATDNVSKWLYESVGDGAARRALRVNQLETTIDRLESGLPRLSKSARRRRQTQLSAGRARLAAQYAEQGKYQLRAGQLLIVDEASMVGTAALAELARQAEAVDAKVLLVGDPAQLEAVDAGGFLGWMERNTDAPVLDRVWRFRNEWEREASLRLRRGDESVIGEYMEHDRVRACQDGTAAETAYKTWLAETTDDVQTLLIAGDNATVAGLNTRAQLDLAERGKVDLEKTVDLRSGVAGVGDVILARQNNRRMRDESGHFIKNGTRLDIMSTERDGSVKAVRQDTGASITVDADYLAASAELGYACTAHRAQGVTVDRSHTVVGAGEGRELFYVAMTRGRDTNMCYVDLPDAAEVDAPDEWGIMRTPVAESARAVLSGVLKTSRAEKTAHEVQDAEHGWATDLGRMIFEYDYVGHAAKETATCTWATETFGQAKAAAMHADPLWPALVQADPATAFENTGPDPESSLADVVAACPDVPRTRSSGLLWSFNPATEDQDRLQSELLSKLDIRLQHLRACVAEDRPDWLTELEAMVPQVQLPDALDAVLSWRAVSGQEDATTLWGIEPKPSDTTMRAYYDTARALIPVPQSAPADKEVDVWDGVDLSEDDQRILDDADTLSWSGGPTPAEPSLDDPDLWTSPDTTAEPSAEPSWDL